MGKPGENPARSRHCELVLTGQKSGCLPVTLCRGDVSRQNIDGKFGTILNALFFKFDEVGREEQGISILKMVNKHYKQLARPIFAALIAACAFFGGCGSNTANRVLTAPEAKGEVTRTVTDDIGRDVVLPRRIDRAISLAPSLTEMIFAAGAGDRLVGVTTYCNYPARTAEIGKVGDTQSPNIERIIALRPQVVFVSTASQLEAFTATLDARNIAVFVIDSANVDDVIADLSRFGEMFGTGETASDAADSLRGRLVAVGEKIRGREPVRVFVQISNDPLFTIGRDSFLTEAVRRAGGASVTSDVPSGYPKLSKETALALDPEVIILSDSEDNRAPNDVFASSRAVKNGRVVRVNADIISRPGPRLVDAIEQIAEELTNAN
jgi:ABC-type Fe3+-hydroxamate transport system substrate-binding protein